MPPTTVCVFASYVPITSASGSIEGVFEVYYDVTELLAKVRRRQLLLQTVVGGTFPAARRH